MNLRSCIYLSLFSITLFLFLSCGKESDLPLPSYKEGLSLRSNTGNDFNFSIAEGTTEAFEEVDSNGDYLVFSAKPGSQNMQDTVMSLSWKTSNLTAGTYEVRDLTIGTFDEDGSPVFVKNVSMQVEVEHFGDVGDRVIGTVSGAAQIQRVPLPSAPPSMVELEGEFNFLRVK